MPTAPTSARLWPWLTALVLAVVLVYAGGLSAPFLFDDTTAIVANPNLTSPWPLTRAMRAPVQSSVSGRPIAALSLALSYAMGGGLAPGVFRMWNVAVLAASALLLFALVRETWRRHAPAEAEAAAPAAYAVALLWALHPLNAEVVGYVTQRTESMMGACTLLTVYAAARAMRGAADASRWRALAVAACAVGMGCKESMVVAPLLVWLYDTVFGAGSPSAALRARRGLYLALAGTWLVLAACIADTPRFRSAGFSTGVSVGTYLVNQAVMVPTYLSLVVWPAPLLVDYGRTFPMRWTTALPGMAVLTLLLALVAVAWRRQRVVAFLGTWCLLTLAPSSSLVPIASEVGAERRMYLPLAALSVLAVLGLRAAIRASAPPAHRRRIAVAAVATLALALATRTALRAATYQDPVRLWREVVEARPHGRAHYNLAIALIAAGRSDEAMAHYRASLPEEPSAHYALGFELAAAGRLEDGVAELETLLRVAPEDLAAPKAAFMLGRTLVRLGRDAEAEHWLGETLRMTPGSTDARIVLADLLSQQQRHAEAIPLYEQYLQRLPGNAAAHHNLGVAYFATGRAAAAVAAFARAVALRPDDPALRASLERAQEASRPSPSTPPGALPAPSAPPAPSPSTGRPKRGSAPPARPWSQTPGATGGP